MFTTAQQNVNELSTTYYTIQTDNGNKKCLRIRAPVREDRQSIHFTFLLDTSGSMESEKRLKNVQWSLRHIIQYLNSSDEVSLIAFNSNSTILQKRQPMTDENKHRMINIINSIHADGDTNLSSSFEMSRECLYMKPRASKTFVSDTELQTCKIKQGLVLLTDGHANSGIHDPTKLQKLLNKLIRDSDGASLQCIGYGVNHNSELLQNLSADGGGSYNVVQNREDVAQIFADILGGLLSCVFQSVEIHIPGIYTKNALNTHYSVNTVLEENPLTSPVTIINIGDLHSENEVVLILPEEVNQVTLKGHNLLTCQHVQYICEIKEKQDANLTFPTHDNISVGLATYYRQETAKLIDNIRLNMKNNRQSDELENYLGDISTLRSSIESKKNIYPNNIYDLLLEELNEIEMAINTVQNQFIAGLNNAEQVALETSQILAQHSAYISMGRGVRSHFTPVTPQLRQLSRQVSSNPRLHTTFSNSIQRHISEHLTSQIEEDEHDEYDNRYLDSSIQGNISQYGNPAIPPPPLRVPIQRELDADGLPTQNPVLLSWIPVSPHSISTVHSE